VSGAGGCGARYNVEIRHYQKAAEDGWHGFKYWVKEYGVIL
jgi:hypothetical protein